MIYIYSFEILIINSGPEIKFYLFDQKYIRLNKKQDISKIYQRNIP